MKEIRAYIKPHKLSEVTIALHHIEGLTGMSVSEGTGFGRGRMKKGPHAICEEVVDYVPHVKIEILCTGELVDEVAEAVRRAAYTGLRGDGKFYVLSQVEDAVQISTGERGDAAI